MDAFLPVDLACDPDDLAIMVGSVLLKVGLKPRIALAHNEQGSVVAIEVWDGQRRVASFDCQPIKGGGETYEAMLNAAIGRTEWPVASP